jgi:hypothetical protein
MGRPRCRALRRGAPPDGWACWAFSNHDVCATPPAGLSPGGGARRYATLMMCLRGSVCLYQGEELGLPEADVPSRICATPTASASGPSSRAATAAARRWSGRATTNGGFSDGKPWLPIRSSICIARSTRRRTRRGAAAPLPPRHDRLSPRPSRADAKGGLGSSARRRPVPAFLRAHGTRRCSAPSTSGEPARTCDACPRATGTAGGANSAGPGDGRAGASAALAGPASRRSAGGLRENRGEEPWPT